MKITAFLPCRKGSERVPEKNIKPFLKYENGLIEIKLQQLIQTKTIDSIVLSTNDDEIIKYASSLNDTKIHIVRRNESLSSSETSTDDLVGHALELIPDGHILWTHVTSPFLDEKLYTKIISKYKNLKGTSYDSLMTTNLVHGFLWSDEGPVNYDRSIEKWPRTQTIKPLHEINSGAFLSSADNYREFKDRIGLSPFFYGLDKMEGFDIDWPDDFKMAEYIYQAKVM